MDELHHGCSVAHQRPLLAGAGYVGSGGIASLDGCVHACALDISGGSRHVKLELII